jgi:soluble lytic murein transglycosylase-like protein
MYLESSTGDIGLMQVNKYVWRGLYSLKRLEWDVIYNASAGSEILTRLIDGVSRHNNLGASPDDLARSVYAAYNGGPTAYGRWRRANEPVTARAIDGAFWAKYKALREGQSFDIVRCAADWDKTHAN